MVRLGPATRLRIVRGAINRWWVEAARMADLKLLAWAEGDEAAAARHLEQELRCRAYTAELRDLAASLEAGSGMLPGPYRRRERKRQRQLTNALCRLARALNDADAVRRGPRAMAR
jgi:hypothetical protein